MIVNRSAEVMGDISKHLNWNFTTTEKGPCADCTVDKAK